MERIAAAAAGDPDARAWLVREWTPRVYRTCLAILRDEAYARDATQDTLIKALGKLHTFRADGRFDPWILQIARNTCYNEFRRRRSRATLVSGEVLDTRADPTPADPDALLDHQRLSLRLEQAMAGLPPQYREILDLYHFQHLKYREIAEVLDLPMGTVMNRIFRARRKMRDALGDLAPDGFGGASRAAQGGA